MVDWLTFNTLYVLQSESIYQIFTHLVIWVGNFPLVTQNLNPYILEIKGLSPTRRASLFGLVKIRLFIWTLGAFIYGPFHHFYSTIQRSNSNILALAKIANDSKLQWNCLFTRIQHYLCFLTSVNMDPYCLKLCRF
jgi:hypothetical protein